MRKVRSVFVLVIVWLGLAAWAQASEVLPDRVIVPKMKTSIYVGSVSLKTTDFERDGDVYNATYNAKVFPWFFGVRRAISR